MEPLGRVEGDPSDDVFSLHRQTEGGAAGDLDHVASSCVRVREHGAWVTAAVDVEPERDGERHEAREGFIEQQRVADRAQFRELEVRVETEC